MTEAPRASSGMTGSAGGAVEECPGWAGGAGGQTEAEVLPWGPEAPASSEQVWAEEAARAGRPEASVVQEEELNLKNHFLMLGVFWKTTFQPSFSNSLGGSGFFPTSISSTASTFQYF